MPSSAELAAAYRQGSADLRAAVAGMTRDQLLARPVPGKWSTLEVVAHIADFDPILVERMKRIIALDDAAFAVADENRFTDRLRYHDRDVEEELRLIEITRSQMARIIETLTPAELQRTGVHSVKGPVTLEAVIAGATKHIAGHLPHVFEKRKALGL